MNDGRRPLIYSQLKGFDMGEAGAQTSNNAENRKKHL